MPFEDEWLARQVDLDAAFSEGFILEPVSFPDLAGSFDRKDVNGRPGQSMARPAIPFSGTFVEAGAMLHAQGRRMADSASHTVAGEKPMIDIPRYALPQRPQPGDIVRRLRTGEVFAVEAYLPEEPVRAWIYLTEAQRREAQPR